MEENSIKFIFFNYFANKILTFICNLFNNQKLTDAHTGYKVFHKDVFDLS